jgi:hypothetical protein
MKAGWQVPSKQSSCWNRGPYYRRRLKNGPIAWRLHAELPLRSRAIGAAQACQSQSPNRGPLPRGSFSRSMSDHERKRPVEHDSYEVAGDLAARLDAAGCEYALGGAIALGFWAEPRGTLDVDVTLFLPLDDPAGCMQLLQDIGCQFDPHRARETLTEHSFCQVHLLGIRLDVFLPMSGFYEVAKTRRREVPIGRQHAYIWDAETLCVFKMMFFRQKDLVDVQSILRTQGASLEPHWVEDRLLELYGERDPRLSRWRELVGEAKA